MSFQPILLCLCVICGKDVFSPPDDNPPIVACSRSCVKKELERQNKEWEETRLKAKLTKTEKTLYAFFLSRQGEVITHKEIAKHLTGIDYILPLARDYCSPLVSKLRKKIGFDRITTVKGKGYKLDES